MTTVHEIEVYRARQAEIMEARQNKKKAQNIIKVERVLAMSKMYQGQKMTYQAIGKLHKVSRQHVHKLLLEFASGKYNHVLKDVANQSEREFSPIKPDYLQLYTRYPL